MTQLRMNENSLKDFDLSELDAAENFRYRFLRSKGMTKKEALEQIIKDAAGDYSQLSEGLALIAEEMEN